MTPYPRPLEGLLVVALEQAVAAPFASSRLADAAKRRRDENDVSVFAIGQRIRALLFRDIAVRSRIQDLAQARSTGLLPLRSAQAEHAGILAEIDRLTGENHGLVTQDIVIETARKRDSFYREELAKSKERLTEREVALKSETQDKIAAALRRPHDTGIPPPADPRLPPPDPHMTPLPLPPESDAAIVSLPSNTQIALNRQSVVWKAQRNTLIAEIRADTWKAVQQAALRRGWRLEATPKPGALDGTDETADDLRAQWTMGKTP